MEFDMMQKAIEAGKKEKAKEILKLIEKLREENSNYYSDHFVVEELLRRLKAECEEI